jgi:diguanylate cyclase (GGDEF)-like protein
MGAQPFRLATALDLSTLVVIGAAISGLLGVFLLSIWRQERVRALAWWGSAYLLGGFSISLWSVDAISSASALPAVPNALLLFACGMIWSAARLFHGRPVRWIAMSAGAVAWVLACRFPGFADAGLHRIVLSSLIVSTYTVVTAQELWRERRKSSVRRWPAVVVPLLHGVVFLVPASLAGLMPQESGLSEAQNGWLAVFAIEGILYMIGAAFIVVVLSKERALRVEKSVACTDSLTGLFNRRAFFDGAQKMKAAQIRKNEPIAALIFDLDNFKSVNDTYGHFVGDEVLLTFAVTISATLRATDLFARLGGEEFVALLPANADEAAIAAERVRTAFQEAGRAIGPHAVGATVSVGVAAAPANSEITALLFEADAALYRAKRLGRNCVAVAGRADPLIDGKAAQDAALIDVWEATRWSGESPTTEACPTPVAA